jgi:hypothetical protein
MNAQFDAMVEKYGRKEATERMNEIRALGGFGNNNGVGGLDLVGVLAESNTTIPTKNKARIAELADVDRKELEKRIEEGRKAIENGEIEEYTVITADEYAKQQAAERKAAERGEPRKKKNMIPPDMAEGISRA